MDGAIVHYGTQRAVIIQAVPVLFMGDVIQNKWCYINEYYVDHYMWAWI